MSYPTVSVVVPVYKGAETIGRCLESIYAQTYPGISEVIVVDDGSPDNVAEVVARDYPQVTLLRQANAGVSAARNRGASVAKGEYIAFLDADDAWLPEKISRQVQVLEKHPEFALLLTRSQWLEADGTPIDLPSSRADIEEIIELRPEYWICGPYMEQTGIYVHPSGWLLRRTVFEQLGGFDTTFAVAEDWQFTLRALRQGFRIAALGDRLFIYTRSPDSLWHSFDRRNLAADKRQWWATLQTMRDPQVMDVAAWEEATFAALPVSARRMFYQGYLRTSAWLLRLAMQRQVPLARRCRLFPHWCRSAFPSLLPLHPRQWRRVLHWLIAATGKSGPAQ